MGSNFQNDLNLIGMSWILLSLTSMLFIIIGYYLPYWIVGSIYLNGRRNTVYFGTFRRCNYPSFNLTIKQFKIENLCGRYSTFSDIPSIYWQMSTVSIGFGCIISILITFFVIPACCFRNFLNQDSAILVGLLQAVSAISVCCGCLLYPLGWNNNEVRDACGKKSDIYHLDECQIGWSYICVLVGSALKLICGVLSICSISKNKKRYYRKCNYNKFKQSLVKNNSFYSQNLKILEK